MIVPFGAKVGSPRELDTIFCLILIFDCSILFLVPIKDVISMKRISEERLEDLKLKLLEEDPEDLKRKRNRSFIIAFVFIILSVQEILRGGNLFSAYLLLNVGIVLILTALHFWEMRDILKEIREVS